MAQSTAPLWLVIAVLLIAVAVVAVYKAGPLLNPEVAVVAPLNSECDLRAGLCTATFPDGGRVSLGISPRSIPVVKPLRFDVRIEGMTADKVEIDFQGVDMNMGYNRTRLQAAGPGHFVGDGMLPVCVRDAMEWEAKVLVDTDKGLLAAPFRFITVKPGAELPGMEKGENGEA
ncbi:MAG TPA: hypothetical protein EYH03_06970 [Chromatiales bacterium]|nr:hypothetical protein [Chromatiales bacterium]